MDAATVASLVSILLLLPFIIEARMAFDDYRTVQRESTDNVEPLIPSRKMAIAMLITSGRRLKQNVWFAWEIHGLTTAFALLLYFITVRLVNYPLGSISDYWIVVVAMLVGALYLTVVTFRTLFRSEFENFIDSLRDRSDTDYRAMAVKGIGSGFVVFIFYVFSFFIFLGIAARGSIREEIILYVATYYLVFIVVTFIIATRKKGVLTD